MKKKNSFFFLKYTTHTFRQYGIIRSLLIIGYAESGEVPIYGQNSILPKEHAQKFFNLPIVRFVRKQLQCGAIATWDSSIHDSTCLNTVTSGRMLFYNCFVNR